MVKINLIMTVLTAQALAPFSTLSQLIGQPEVLNKFTLGYLPIIMKYKRKSSKNESILYLPQFSSLFKKKALLKKDICSTVLHV